MKEKIECFKKCFKSGVCAENPTFTLMLGLCPTLAVTVSAENGFGIGAAAIFVLLGTNIIVALVKDLIPSEVRIPCYVLIIATFVTIAKLILQAYFSQVYARLGLFVDIMVVNCIILGRAEAFACKNTDWASIADALGMGVGFTLAATFIGSIRELLGSGKILGIPVMGSHFDPIVSMILPPGAFFTIGILMAILAKLNASSKQHKIAGCCIPKD